MRMREALRLANDVSFPEAKIILLWRKKDWREGISAFCETEPRRREFQIGRWAWMSGMEMDTVSKGVGDTVVEGWGSVELTL